MKFTIQPGRLHGATDIPASKSHTVRAVFLALMGEGTSRLHAPLDSADTRAALRAAKALGADVREEAQRWTIRGCAGQPEYRCNSLDLANSGTSLRIMLGIGSLPTEGELRLYGDAQLSKRPATPLVDALKALGADIKSLPGNGCAPFIMYGGLEGGYATLDAHTSQYLTSLLMACPFAANTTTLKVPLLNESAYVGITLDWLRRLGLDTQNEGMQRFRIPGGQNCKSFERRIPADFSSATFFLAAGALRDNSVECHGLDFDDPQPDKAVVDYLQQMGAIVEYTETGIRVSAAQLRGCELDLNETPDALPMMAALGCYAKGETRLVNVAHARIKETDRIAAMACELRKMGADIEEREDGLIIREHALRGADVDGWKDHRIVMALAVAATAASGTTTIDGAEAVGVTFPDFSERLRALGAQLETQ